MSLKDFEKIEKKLGWKHEYYSGEAHITPFYITVPLHTEIKPIDTSSINGVEIRPIVESDSPTLEKSYVDAFKRTIDYCDCKIEDLMVAAKKEIKRFFPSPSVNGSLISRVAVIDGEAIAGAMVVWEDRIWIQKNVGGLSLRDQKIVHSFETGLMLQNLFVTPRAQRKKIATQLVADLINTLNTQGRQGQWLWSSFTLGNNDSSEWHDQFGFKMEFDMKTHKFRVGLLDLDDEI